MCVCPEEVLTSLLLFVGQTGGQDSSPWERCVQRPHDVTSPGDRLTLTLNRLESRQSLFSPVSPSLSLSLSGSRSCYFFTHTLWLIACIS